MRLKAENICFRYGEGAQILESVHFHLDSDEVVGITAPSGFGKTTLGKILAGDELPQGGVVTLDGEPLPQKGYHPVQLILQHPEKAVNPKWKMRKVLMESGWPTQEMLDAVGIAPGWLNRWPSELSGGELQRFCVLRALSPQTRFIVADEITTMLDAITQAQIWHTVLAYAKAHDIGVAVISHDRPLLDQISTRIVDLTASL